MSDAEKVVAEWTAAMEGVTPGEWGALHNAPDDYYTFGYGFEVRQVDTAPADKHHWPVRICTSPGGVTQLQPNRDADWIARCSPTGIRSLLKLIEKVTKERDEVALATHRQGFCLHECAAHIGPDTAVTVDGLPRAVKALVAERDELREIVNEMFGEELGGDRHETPMRGSYHTFVQWSLRRRARAALSEKEQGG